MKKFWMSMFCVLALTLSVGFVACSNENSKDDNKNSSNSQDYDVTEDDIYTDNY